MLVFKQLTFIPEKVTKTGKKQKKKTCKIFFSALTGMGLLSHIGFQTILCASRIQITTDDPTTMITQSCKRSGVTLKKL